MCLLWRNYQTYTAVSPRPKWKGNQSKCCWKVTWGQTKSCSLAAAWVSRSIRNEFSLRKLLTWVSHLAIVWKSSTITCMVGLSPEDSELSMYGSTDLSDFIDYTDFKLISLLFPIYLVLWKSEPEDAGGPSASRKLPTKGSLEDIVYPTDSPSIFGKGFFSCNWV